MTAHQLLELGPGGHPGPNGGPLPRAVPKPASSAAALPLLTPEVRWALGRLGVPGMDGGPGGPLSLAPPGGGGLGHSAAEGHRSFFMDWLVAQAVAQPEQGSAFAPVVELCPDDCSAQEPSDPSEMDLSVSEETVGPEKSPAEDGLPPMLELRITELEKEQAQLKQALLKLVQQTMLRLATSRT